MVVAGQTSNQRLRSVVVVAVWLVDSQCTPLKSTIFNNVETNKLIEIVKVDTENLKNECREVVSNPFLLHCFRNIE